MPIANSTAELEQMIRKQMMNALQVVQSKVEADMFEEVGKFYTQGNPRLYQRTGNLGSSPRTTGISGGGNNNIFVAGNGQAPLSNYSMRSDPTNNAKSEKSASVARAVARGGF